MHQVIHEINQSYVGLLDEAFPLCHKGSGQIKLFDGDDRLVEAFTVSSSIISGSIVTLNPATDLKPDNSYYIQIPSTAFTDAAGNNYAGIINKKLRPQNAFE